MAAFVAAVLAVSAAPAHAQLFEDVGTRARGMGGAFVAVADDATASWWNPAGLATGAYFNAVLEKGWTDQPESPTASGPARRTRVNDFAVAFPALGLSYYRVRTSEAGAGVAPVLVAPGPQILGVRVPVRTLAVNQFGATVGQSLGDHVVVGATLKVLRGGVASQVADGSSEGLDVGDDLTIRAETRTDADAGAMVSFPHVRLGLSVRNLTEPAFGDGSERQSLDRQARVGVALLSNPTRVIGGLTISADADLTKTATLFGDVRHVALGGEVWLAGRRVGVRGGLTANTIGDARLVSSAGISVAPTRSFFIEAARVFGEDGSLKGWSTAVRLTY